MNVQFRQYELFGYNPVADAFRQALLEIQSSQPVQEIAVDEKIEVKEEEIQVKDEKPPVKAEPQKPKELSPELRKFIPNIKSAGKRSTEHVDISTLRKNANKALKEKNNPAEAILNLKRICEITVRDRGDWDRLLSLARQYYAEIVPELCRKILLHVSDRKLILQAKGILDQSQTVAKVI